MWPDSPMEELLVLVVGGEAHRTPPARTDRMGGEWDPWYALPVRRRRSLVGSGFARSGAMWPDELADMIRLRHPHLDGQDPLEWYFRHCARVQAERRRNARARRHLSKARAGGHPTYYARRVALAQAEGYTSLWGYRKARGWS